MIMLLFVAKIGFAQTIQYQYDDLGRMTKATYANGNSITYNYDVLGNRTSVVVSGTSCQAATATLSGTQTINAGQTANLSVSFTGDAPYTLVFNGQTTNGITDNPYIIPVSPTATTTYTLTSVSNACGAGTVSGSAVVTVNGGCVLPTATLSGTQTIYYGDYATLSVNSTGASGFTIVVNGKTYSNIANTYSFSVNPTATTTYTITSVSNSCGTGTVSGSAVVTVDTVSLCDPLERNNTAATASVISGNVYTSPDVCLQVWSDDDWYKWTYNGTIYYLLVHAYRHTNTGKYKLLLSVDNNILTVQTASVDGSSTDTYLTLFSADATTVLRSNDDIAAFGNKFSKVTYPLPDPCATLQPPTVSSATINSGQTATLTASGCGGTVNWYSAAGGGTSLAGGTSFTTPALTTTTTYYASCTVNNCVSTSRGSGTVTVNSTGSGEIFSVKTGSWHDPTTWDCNCVPNNSHTVEIKANHTITVSTADANLKDLKFSSGNLDFQNQRKLCYGCN